MYHTCTYMCILIIIIIQLSYLHVSYVHVSCIKLLFIYTILGPNYYVRVLSTLDRELLKPNSSVALHKHSNALVDVLPPEADSSIAMLSAEEKPDVMYSGECVSVSVSVDKKDGWTDGCTYWCLHILKDRYKKYTLTISKCL